MFCNIKKKYQMNKNHLQKFSSPRIKINFSLFNALIICFKIKNQNTQEQKKQDNYLHYNQHQLNVFEDIEMIHLSQN